MTLERLSRTVGPAGTNVHLLADARTREAIAIDTAIPSLDWIREELEARGWILKLIVSSHGHWDHTGDNAAVQAHTGAPIEDFISNTARSDTDKFASLEQSFEGFIGGQLGSVLPDVAHQLSGLAQLPNATQVDHFF